MERAHDTPITDGPQSTLYAPVRALLERAVGEGVFPGAVFGVWIGGAAAALGAVGRLTYEAASAPVLVQTSFDLASVSKVLATTAMAMLLWQRGALALDTLLGELLPGFVVGHADPRRRGVTLRLLLAHASGLPAYAPLFQTSCTPEELMRAVLQLELVSDPGTQSAYSDPGFILLGKALEVLAGRPLDVFCREEIFRPLGLAGTRYRPAQADRPQIPPTEAAQPIRGPLLRAPVQGEVHDENCWVLGGVSGHAGLFAPALDVLRFAEAMLAPLRPGAAGTLFAAETVREFTRRAELPPGSSRALGWDTPSGTPSSSGTRFRAAAFGHLGYTGTSLWIDPEQDCAVVLLTNRTFPTRANQKIQALRPAFHDVVFRCIESGTSG